MSGLLDYARSTHHVTLRGDLSRNITEEVRAVDTTLSRGVDGSGVTAAWGYSRSGNIPNHHGVLRCVIGIGSRAERERRFAFEPRQFRGRHYPAAGVLRDPHLQRSGQHHVAVLRRLTELYRDPERAVSGGRRREPGRHRPAGAGSIAETDARVHLLEGKEARAWEPPTYAGSAHALDTLEAEVVVQMDADFSHDPADAGRLAGAGSGGSGRGNRQPLRCRRRRRR